MKTSTCISQNVKPLLQLNQFGLIDKDYNSYLWLASANFSILIPFHRAKCFPLILIRTKKISALHFDDLIATAVTVCFYGNWWWCKMQITSWFPLYPFMTHPLHCWFAHRHIRPAIFLFSAVSWNYRLCPSRCLESCCSDILTLLLGVQEEMWIVHHVRFPIMNQGWIDSSLCANTGKEKQISNKHSTPLLSQNIHLLNFY